MAGTYFVLTSLYCLLAFLPYTYTAFIKAPPYPWMPWFAHHHVSLYWLAAATGILGAEFSFLRRDWHERKLRLIWRVGLAIAVGLYLGSRPFLPGIQSNRAAYWWGIASLLPVIWLALWRSSATRGDERNVRKEFSILPFGYSSGLLVALVVSVVYIVGAQVQVYRESHAMRWHSDDIELAVWSVVSHFALAVAVLSALNLIYWFAGRTTKPQTARRWLVGLAIVTTLSFILARFLDTAMSFDGWNADFYAFTLALALTLWGFSLTARFLERREAEPAKLTSKQLVAAWAAIAALLALALMSRSLIGGEDWNGFVGNTWALILWIGMSVCVYRLRPARANHGGVVIVGTLLASAFVYKGLQATEIFWAKQLGSTDDEISLKLEEYGGRDASFQLVNHALGNGRNQACGDLCRILREYTNIRDTHISRGVRLVENLSAAPGVRPNVFIFVIDSMRPDYLGTYNPAVDYTPNLDALARDSVVFRHTHTEYAGTSISEPAIWAGAQLLHTHFPQPFDEVNSLRTLARTDGYQMVASYDSVVRQLFMPGDNLTRLDTDKELWNRYEACSTIAQLEANLDSRQAAAKPVLFYAQPMNVHQFARNDVPSPTSQHWPDRAGLNTRITYEVHWVDSCLGQFFGYLKQHGMYDDSIIVVASDHGDATGEFGRWSHSTSIWPEIMRVPLIIHLPAAMRKQLVYDDSRLSTLTDIAPTLYYLLGHRPIVQNPLYGRPLFAETREDLDRYPAKDLLLASDVRAVYGILTADERYFYATYDSPAQSFLFDLNTDPNAEHSILTPALKQRYDEEIIEHLHQVGDYYGYKPGVGSLLTAAQR